VIKVIGIIIEVMLLGVNQCKIFPQVGSRITEGMLAN